MSTPPDIPEPAPCGHASIWFDRAVCPEPCTSMHDRCVDCGGTIDICPRESDAE